MSYVHHIWNTATPTLHRILPFMLVALLAFAAGAATVVYSGAITHRFAGGEIASEQQSIPIPPEAPAVARPRGEAIQPNSYWEYLRLNVSGLAVPEEVPEASLSNGYWDYVRPESGYQIWYERVHGTRPQD